MSDSRNTVLGRVVTLVRALLTLPIWIYQRAISPAFPSSCIYTPSCSEYARQSILKHGVLGVVSAGLRILRCTGALFEGGEDPVPDRFSLRFFLSRYRTFWRHRR